MPFVFDQRWRFQRSIYLGNPPPYGLCFLFFSSKQFFNIIFLDFWFFWKSDHRLSSCVRELQILFEFAFSGSSGASQRRTKSEWSGERFKKLRHKELREFLNLWPLHACFLNIKIRCNLVFPARTGFILSWPSLSRYYNS
jgi:hypothetical protein